LGRLIVAGAVATAIAELVVFILVGQWLGWGWAILLVLAASLAGALLLRRESTEGWRKLRDVVRAGRPPGGQVIDGLVGLVGALLLAVPGLLTGVVGALVLIPPVRRLVGRQAERRAERRLTSAAAGDLFGPRRVRVYRGEPRREAPTRGPGPTAPGPTMPGPTIEGEIIGPAGGERGGGQRETPEDR
jgi:UPF0716 protein FxsA